MLAWNLASDRLGALPYKTLTKETGEFALRLLVLTLAISPLARLWHWPRLLKLRRIVGVTCAGYGFAHLAAFTTDKGVAIGVVGNEILARPYLTIGAIALTTLMILAGTSFDAAVRKLGSRRWRRLHRLAYLAGALALAHFAMQSKLGGQAAILTGLFALLMFYRLLPARTSGSGSFAALCLVAALVTAGAEASYVGLTSGLSGWRVLEANLDFVVGPRPAGVVLGLGLGVATVAAVLDGLRAHRMRAVSRA